MTQATTKTLKELLAEREALDKKILREKNAAATRALQQIHALIAEFGFTAQQVVPLPAPKKHVPAKYYDSSTGASWSGRGKPPAWIASKDRNQFFVKQSIAKDNDGGPLLAEMAAAAAWQTS